MISGRRLRNELCTHFAAPVHSKHRLSEARKVKHHVSLCLVSFTVFLEKTFSIVQSLYQQKFVCQLFIKSFCIMFVFVCFLQCQQLIKTQGLFQLLSLKHVLFVTKKLLYVLNFSCHRLSPQNLHNHQ